MSYSDVQVMSNQVLIELPPEQEHSSGGIIMPTAIQPRDRGTIKVLGNGEEIVHLGLEVEDFVVFDTNETTKITIDGVEHDLVVVPVEHILVKIG